MILLSIQENVQEQEHKNTYDRINTDSAQDSPINDAIMNRIVHNAYIVPVEGAVSMRERHGLSAQLKAGAGK